MTFDPNFPVDRSFISTLRWDRLEDSNLWVRFMWSWSARSTFFFIKEFKRHNSKGRGSRGALSALDFWWTDVFFTWPEQKNHGREDARIYYIYIYYVHVAHTHTHKGKFLGGIRNVWGQPTEPMIHQIHRKFWVLCCLLVSLDVSCSLSFTLVHPEDRWWEAALLDVGCSYVWLCNEYISVIMLTEMWQM